MSQGCVITLSPAGKVVMRQPVWPFPEPGHYPLQLPDGRIQFFAPVPYFHFPLYEAVPLTLAQYLPKEAP